MGGAEEKDVLLVLGRIEAATSESALQVQNLMTAVNKNTHALNNQTQVIESAVSNVMERNNGIIPLDMMRISDHKEILSSTIHSQTVREETLAKGHLRQVISLSVAFTLIIGVLVGARLYARTLPEPTNSLQTRGALVP